MSQDDPQRTEEWEKPTDLADPGDAAQTGQPAAGSTADEAVAAAGARESASQAELARAEARGAELRADLAEADARRAEEQTTKAHEAVEDAEKKEEKLSRKERKAQERAAAAEGEAAKAREQATAAERLAVQSSMPGRQAPATLSGANVMAPGLGTQTDPATAAAAHAGGSRPEPAALPAGQESALDRPEVLAGIVFAGAFLAARIFKRLVD